MLKKLKKRLQKEKSQEKSDIDFQLKNDLIYYTRDKSRLCILATCEKKIFELAHDQNNHARHHRAYQKLIDIIYIPRLFRKIRLYIKHCSACELNQIKRHFSYEELILISTTFISFRTLTMNFIVTLSEDIDFVLTVICKTSRRLSIIFELIT
jgi:hypothetical protein